MRAKLFSVDGERYLLLPDGMHVDAREVRITRSGDEYLIQPHGQGDGRGMPDEASPELAEAMRRVQA